MIKLPSNIIPRDRYLLKIEPYIGKSIIKVLTGQRRVGKSYILYQIIKKILKEESKANIIYINKEDLQFGFIKTYEDLDAYIKVNIRADIRNYIFIDEIQDINEFERSLRSLLLDQNNDIYITGSNSKMLSGELATFLSGRYIEIDVYSLSYPEFLVFHKLDDNNKSLDLFSKYGGLPYLINLTLEDAVVLDYLKNIYNTIVYRDVVSRYAVRNTFFLERLLSFISDNIGSLFSSKKISDFLKSQNIKISVNQILTYMNYFLSAYVIHRVSKYDLIGKRFFEVGEKYYFDNLGIRNSIVGYKISDRSKILENLVFNHLLYLGYNVKVGYLQDNEIDFVCELDNERVYIQVALKLDSEQVLNREFGNLLKINDNYPKYVISYDEFSGNTFDGIKVMHIREFLMLQKVV